ncbi:hypothetical protein QOS04_38335, partial [Cupriavidus sp. LEh21]|nr:hypothetical protein [Cupriavidus sp. LEh21]
PLLDQRQEDLTFHDILAAANPNPMLRFSCELINEMIRQLVVFGNVSTKGKSGFTHPPRRVAKRVRSSLRFPDGQAAETVQACQPTRQHAQRGGNPAAR